jgi:predicted small lipoprotein YifL
VGEAAGKRAKIGLSGKISLLFHDHPALARSGQSLYGAPAIGDVVVNPRFRPGWAIILLAATALALGGCGRKGPLDLPPTAQSASTAAPVDTETEAAHKPSVFNPTYGADAGPAAPKGSKKSFILDPLLGN